MGYNDAIRDGIRFSGKNEPRGYYPRCQFCGTEFFSMNYRSDIRYTCDHCKPLKKLLLAAGLSLKQVPSRIMRKFVYKSGRIKSA